MGRSNEIVVVILALICGALLTVPIAALSLWLFRRSLQRGMIADAREQVDAGTHNSAAKAAPTGAATRTLAFRVVDQARAAPRSYDGDHFRSAKQSLGCTVLAYTLAGLIYALLFGVGWALQFPEGLRAWHRVVGLAVFYWWPTVLAVGLIAATTRAERLTLGLFYFALATAVSAYLLAVSPKLTVKQLLLLWVMTNGPATFLMLAFLRRRVRAVGPLVVAFVTISVFGAAIAPPLVLRNDHWIRTAVMVGGAVGLGGGGTYYAVLISGFLLFGCVSWWLLRRFGELYRRKQLSDQSLTLDSLFLVFAVEQSVALDPTGAHIYAGVAAFIGYKAVIWLGLSYLRARCTTGTLAPVLLHLRVFSLGRRSESLFDGLTKLWRRIGSIVMIAGPDLIRTTVEPHEFLEFIGGNISRRFVSDQTDLNRRIAALDRRPDPDGRYRVNQFFCHRDTWQMTMSKLARESSAVLMDLRNFSQSNQGCIFELAQLLNSVDLARVLFVIDSTTDQKCLEQTLQDLWKRIPAESPNFSTAEPTVRFFVAQGGTAEGARVLFRQLLSSVSRSQVAVGVVAGC